MQANIHGSLHRALGIPNQDACRELINKEKNKKVRIVCDGCTNININDPTTFLQTHSEVGAGLFCSLYEDLEEPFDVEKFPENASNIMEKMLSLIGFSKENKDKKIEWVFHNYCFTILACFETENSFVVYFFGDGVIIVKNHFDTITYIERKSGNNPPYLVNNFLYDMPKVEFKKFVFDKKEVKNIGIASDGIIVAIRKENPEAEAMPSYEKLRLDRILSKDAKSILWDPENELREFIIENSKFFHDDTTIVW